MQYLYLTFPAKFKIKPVEVILIIPISYIIFDIYSNF